MIDIEGSCILEREDVRVGLFLSFVFFSFWFGGYFRGWRGLCLGVFIVNFLNRVGFV